MDATRHSLLTTTDHQDIMSDIYYVSGTVFDFYVSLYQCETTDGRAV